MKIKEGHSRYQFLAKMNPPIANIDFTGVVEYCDGVKYHDWICIDHFKNGRYHREDGPASYCFERVGNYSDGHKLLFANIWRLDGRCHRIDGAAIERSDGLKQWFLHGTSTTESEYKIQVLKLK
jgi:hypothetical protein